MGPGDVPDNRPDEPATNTYAPHDPAHAKYEDPEGRCLWCARIYLEGEVDKLRDTVIADKGNIVAAHNVLTKAGIPPARGAACDDPECFSHLTHRTHTLVEERDSARLQIQELQIYKKEVEDANANAKEWMDAAESANRLKYESAADYLEAEAKRIPLGEGNAQRGFSSTYNALAFAVEVLRAACAVKRISVVTCPSCGMAYRPTGPRDVLCRECERA